MTSGKVDEEITPLSLMALRAVPWLISPPKSHLHLTGISSA
jgi:hypothetical protein